MSELSFSYSPWWLLLAIIVASLMVYALYLNNNKYSPKQKWLLGALRFSSLLLLSVLLLRPLIISQEMEEQKPYLIWLEDASLSVSEEDPNFSAFLAERDKSLERLKQKYELRSFRFADRLYVDSVAYRGLTNIERSVQDLKSLTYDQDIKTMVLLSDGIVNRGRALNSIDFSFTERLYSLKAGQKSQERFISISDLRHNEKVLLDRSLLLEYDLKAVNKQGEEIKIQVLDENGAELISDKLKIDKPTWYESGILELEAKTEGLQECQLIIEDSQGAKVRRPFSFEVISDKIRVAVYTQESQPDIAALARALSRDPLVEINYKSNLADLEAETLDLVLSTKAQPAFLSLMEQKQIPFILLQGAEGTPGYLQTLYQNSNSESEKQYANWPQDFSLFPLSERMEDIWKDFPPLDGIYGKADIPLSAKVLFYKRIDNLSTQEPIAFFDEESLGTRYCVFLARGLWRWRMYNYRKQENFDAFDDFIGQIKQYLLAQEKREPLQIIWEKEILEGLSTKLKAKAYDKSSNLINNKDLSIRIYQDGKVAYQYKLNPYRNIYQLELNDLKAGRYTYEAELDLGDDKLTKKGTVVVEENNLESRDLQANYEALEAAAETNGGKSYKLEELSQLVENLMNNEASGQLVEKRNKEEILSRWPLFFVILGLVSLEWFLRKYWGQY